jgi:hypothetical protein
MYADEMFVLAVTCDVCDNVTLHSEYCTENDCINTPSWQRWRY